MVARFLGDQVVNVTEGEVSEPCVAVTVYEMPPSTR
jgi:hypothetical protein